MYIVKSEANLHIVLNMIFLSLWIKPNVFPLRREKEKLTALRSHYSTAIENVNVSIEENEEAVTEALKETKTSKDELSALSKTVGFHI